MVIEAPYAFGGGKLKEKADEESTKRSAKSCDTGLKVVNKEDGAKASTHVDDDDDLMVIEAPYASGGGRLEENSQYELSGQMSVDLKEILLACLSRRKFGKGR